MEYWLPMVPPIREDAVQTESERRFYRRMKHIVTGFLRAGRPQLLSSGVPEVIVNQLELNTLMEMADEYHNIHESSGYTPARNSIEKIVKWKAIGETKHPQVVYYTTSQVLVPPVNTKISERLYAISSQRGHPSGDASSTLTRNGKKQVLAPAFSAVSNTRS